MTEDIKVADVTDDDTDTGFSIFDICETDTEAEEEGRWFTNIFRDESKIDIKLRRMTSKKSMDARRRLEKGYRKYLKNGEFPEHILERVLNEQVASGVIVDWRNIKVRDEAGKLVDLPYSQEAAIMLLTKLKTFRDGVFLMSTNMDNFRREEREELVKN